MNKVFLPVLRFNRSANLLSIQYQRSLVLVNISRQFHYSHPLRVNKTPKAVINGSSSSSSSKMQPRFLVSLDPEHPHAKAPTRGSELAAGYDLYASQNVIIPKGGRLVVPTGIRVAIPEGSYGRVAPRSGLASKHGIDCGAGVIDADYRGLLGVLLFNFGDSDFTINIGDRIAQLILEQIFTPQVETVESLTETVRGEGGFGSTGGFSAPVIKS